MDCALGNADLELRLYPGEEGLLADIRFAPDETTTGSDRVQRVPVRLDQAQLLACEHEPERYGRLLSQMLFADLRLVTALDEAVRSVRERNHTLSLRLRIDTDDDQLQAVSWERLIYPNQDTTFALSRRTLLARYLEPNYPESTPVPYRGALRSLIVIASPLDLQQGNLPTIDVATEERRTLGVLSDFQPVVLARPADMPTIQNLDAALKRHQPDLLYILCHGMEEEGETYLLLEEPDGKGGKLQGRRLAELIGDLTYRPRLVVLGVCHSGGSGSADRELMRLGPRLVRAGVPAVIAMRGAVPFKTLEIFAQTLFEELRLHGQIDLAVATARNNLANANQLWWMPVLTMRLRSGRLWVEGERANAPSRRLEPRERNRLDRDDQDWRGQSEDFEAHRRSGDRRPENERSQRGTGFGGQHLDGRREQAREPAPETSEQILALARSALDEALFQLEQPSKSAIERIERQLNEADALAAGMDDRGRARNSVAFERARLYYLNGQFNEADELLTQVQLFAMLAGLKELIADVKEYQRCIEVRRRLDLLAVQGESRERKAQDALRRLQRVLEERRSPAASLLVQLLTELAVTPEEQVNAAALGLILGSERSREQ